MKWITRKNVKVDRVACPWLIQRFIDPEAHFLFVDEADLVSGLDHLSLVKTMILIKLKSFIDEFPGNPQGLGQNRPC